MKYLTLGVILLSAMANHYRLHKLKFVDQFIMTYGGLRGGVAFALVQVIDPKVSITEYIIRGVFYYTYPIITESASRANVRDDDDLHHLLDGVRAGHHDQAARQVPQREARVREEPEHERAHRGPVHGPRGGRHGGHPRGARAARVSPDETRDPMT